MNRFRTILHLCLAQTVAALWPISTHAAEDSAGFLTIAEARDFCAQLNQPSRQEFDALLGDFSDPFHRRSTIDFENIRLLNASAAEQLLDLAVTNAFGMIDLVAHPIFLADGPCALIVPDDVLMHINRLFDLHAVWLLQTRDLRDEPIGMQYFLFGQGELLVGYPREARVSVPDYEVRGSDRFRYQPYTQGRISMDGTVPGIRDLLVLETPGSEPGNFRGPYNSRIKHFVISPAGDIRVEYSVPILGNETIDLPNLRIERR